MKGLRLTAFEVNHQLRSITFIALLCLFTIFVADQMKEVFHYPVHNAKDIEVLQKSGAHEYLFVPASEAELKSATIQYLQDNIDTSSIPAERVNDARHVIGLLQNKTFDEVYTAMHEDEWISGWLRAGKNQFSQKIGSIAEVNQNLQRAVGTTGYGPQLYEKYVTYMQICAAMLMFPLFLLLFTRDSRHNMSEMIYSQPISSAKYILSRYLGTLLSLLLYLYGFGMVLNLISTARFAYAGWDMGYTFFFKDFVVYLLPTVVFLSAFIMLLMLLFKKAIAVFPVYIAYVLYNATPGVFEGGSSFGMLFRAIIRLDNQTVSLQEVMLNRCIYLLLSAVMIVAACKLYARMNNSLSKGVTL
ncbi:hypothetical protein [Paenibacillus sp. BAC0078]